MHIECNHFSEFRSYLIPLVVQVADDGVGFVHELFPFVERRRERAERGAALPVPLDDVLVHGHFESRPGKTFGSVANQFTSAKEDEYSLFMSLSSL